MLNNEQNAAWRTFQKQIRDSNQLLDHRNTLLVAYAAAIALDCDPCVRMLLDESKRSGIRREELDEVLAQVMAVAAQQKQLQTEKAQQQYDREHDPY